MKRTLVKLEHELEDAFNQQYMLPPDPSEAGDHPADLNDEWHPGAASEEMPSASAPSIETPVDAERITSHTQNRLASYTMFDAARSQAAAELNKIGESLANILGAQHMSQQFLSDCYADIHRANELEVANEALVAENRSLQERSVNLQRLRNKYDALVDMLKKREAKLIQETETLRAGLNDAKFELVESRNLVARIESKHGELHAALLAKSAQAEQAAREAELLREKNVNLTIDLERTMKQLSDLRRQHEEVAALHSAEAARNGDLRVKLAAEEKEAERMRKAHDALEARSLEAAETLQKLEQESYERDRRFEAEVQAMKMEIQTLNSRLGSATAQHMDAASELAAARARIADLEAEKKTADKRFATLQIEVENERRHRAAKAEAASAAALSADQVREMDELRSQVDELNATVRRLTPYARFYAAAKARARAKGEKRTTETRPAIFPGVPAMNVTGS